MWRSPQVWPTAPVVFCIERQSVTRIIGSRGCQALVTLIVSRRVYVRVCLSVGVSKTLMLNNSETKRFRGSCPIFIGKCLYGASISGVIDDVTWLNDVIIVTSQSSKSSHSKNRTRINYPCGSFGGATALRQKFGSFDDVSMSPCFAACSAVKYRFLDYRQNERLT